MNKKIFKMAVALLLVMLPDAIIAQVKYTQQDVDDMSYNLGFAHAKGLKAYLENEMDMDMNHLDSFINGLTGEEKDSTKRDLYAYNLGVVVYNRMVNKTDPSMNYDLFGDSLAGRFPLDIYIEGYVKGINATDDEYKRAQKIADDKIKFIKTEEELQIYSGNKAAGEKFLEVHKSKKEIRVLPSGVQYKIVRKGKGKTPTYDDTVKVNFKGKTFDGIIFADTYKDGKPMVMECGKAMSGFAEALTHMPVGSIWEVCIPQDKAYAERGLEKIKPFSVLIFLIELISIE